MAIFACLILHHYYHVNLSVVLLPPDLVVVQLRVRPEIAAAAALGHGTLGMPCEPLPGVVQVKHMLATETECWEATGHSGLLLLLGFVGAWYADDLETNDAARQMAAAVGTAHTGVDAGREERVPRLERRRRRGVRGVLPGKGCLGVTVDAAQGNLARGRLNGRNSIAFRVFGRFDLEFRALEEELVTLEVSAVGISPGAAADVVHVARVADGENQRRRLDIMELLNVAGEYIDHGVADASQDDAFQVAILRR